jgi:hypothetical protein
MSSSTRWWGKTNSNSSLYRFPNSTGSQKTIEGWPSVLKAIPLSLDIILDIAIQPLTPSCYNQIHTFPRGFPVHYHIQALSELKVLQLAGISEGQLPQYVSPHGEWKKGKMADRKFIQVHCNVVLTLVDDSFDKEIASLRIQILGVQKCSGLVPDRGLLLVCICALLT